MSDQGRLSFHEEVFISKINEKRVVGGGGKQSNPFHESIDNTGNSLQKSFERKLVEKEYSGARYYTDYFITPARDRLCSN